MKKELKERLSELDETDLQTSWSKEDLWTAVASKLDPNEGKQRRLNDGIRFLPWAAVVLFTIGFYWWSAKEPAITVEIRSIAVIENLLDERMHQEALDEGKQLIQETCDKQLAICESPQFKSLYLELLQIEEEKLLLLGIVDQYGSDETSIKALIELKNAESSITGQLISLIMA